MFKFVILADDLTGSNATCALIKKIGIKTSSLIKLENDLSKYETDLISYSTNTRGEEKEKAYEKVKHSMKILKNKEVLLYSKRIDSTLRGNVGSEIDAMLDSLNTKTIALVVPSFPDSGRIVVNKIMLVNGVLLKNSDAGSDPKTPVISSDVFKIIKSQTKYNVSYIPISEIAKGEANIIKKLKKYSVKSRIIIFDSTTNSDIELIAKSAIKSGIKFITSDPGPFSMQCIKEIQREHNIFRKFLIIVGSATDLTKKQLEFILQNENIFLEKLSVDRLFNETTNEEEIKRVVLSIKKSMKKSDLFLITSSPLGDTKKADLLHIAKREGKNVEEISNIISDSLAEISKRIIVSSDINERIDGIYVSGGDTSIALLKSLNALGVEIKDEMMPLIAYGKILGGDANGIKIITKGGMVGSSDTIKLCLNKIRNDT